MPTPAGSTVGLFAGVDAVINQCLGVTDYRTKTAARVLAASTAPLDGAELVGRMFETLRDNWRCAMPARASRQNFRWHAPQLALSERNSSPEVTLERAFIRACAAAGRTDWSNQVPTISGFSGPHSNRRRAIDLVHCGRDGSFEFVELKVDSNTPVYAAAEVLLYGLLWLLSRQDRAELGYQSNAILDSNSLQLSTLAPAEFYAGLTPTSLASEIERGVAALGKRFGVGMSFRMTAFPQDFHWQVCSGPDELFHWFDDRTSLNQCV